MDDPEAKQKLSLPFGDVIKRVAFAIYNQLQNVLHNMRIQSPELRTQTLILFISRSKKKLAQLLAITRWLEMPGVSQFFSNMSQLHFKISMKENRLNENQDALYFTHSQLFSRRIRSLDVVTAKDILARGTYPHLPSSIFSSGSMTGNSLESTQLTEISLRRSLDLYLRSKLALNDEVPPDINSSTIDNGVLTLRVNNMYELMLTIDYLDICSPWNILRLKLCVSSHSNESFHSQQNLSEVENDVLMVMRRISAKSHLPISVATANADGKSNEDLLQLEASLPDATTMTIQDATVDDISVQKCRSEIVTPPPLLPRFHLICQHTALATALRYLYLQALETSRTIWVGICQAEFQEKRDYSQLVFRFWKSHMTGYYQYELRVIQIRSSSQNYVPMDVETALVDEDGKEIGGDVGLTADVRDFKRESALNARPESLQSDGSSSSSSSSSSSLLQRKTKELKLIVELWTCSAPDDSEGSLKMTRRRVKENHHESNRRTPYEVTIRNSAAAKHDGTGLTSGPDHVQYGDSVGLFDATEFVKGGVTFGGMLQKVLGYCASNRLDVLHRRFLKTPGVLAAQSCSQSRLTLIQEPSRLIACIGDAELTVFVDTLSGTFSMASKQLGDVAKGASRDCSLFLSEINNIESEHLAGQIHTAASSPPLTAESTAPSSSSGATASATADLDGVDVVSGGSNNNSNDFNINYHLRPLSTATSMIQHLAVAHWSGLMKRVLSVENRELHAASLYSAALSLCSNSHLNLSKEDEEKSPNGDQEIDGISSSKVLPLLFEWCSWSVDGSSKEKISQTLSLSAFSNILKSLKQVTQPVDPRSEPEVSMANRPVNMTKEPLRRHIEADPDTDDPRSSRLSLALCLAVDGSLCPNIYALLYSTSATATAFVPPTVIKAMNLHCNFNISLNNLKGCQSTLDVELAVEEIERGLASAIRWAKECIESAPSLSTFGFYIPTAVKSNLGSKPAAAADLTTSSTIVLWCDSVSLITVQFGSSGSSADNKHANSSRYDDNTIYVSLLCPIPLPGVGTLGISGPPRCVVGVPRVVTSEESDRMKRRCISIGEISLTIGSKVPAEDDVTGFDSPTKRQRTSASYVYQCGKLAYLEAFHTMSGLVQNDLYSALAQEILQHSLSKYPFSAPVSRRVSMPGGISIVNNEDSDALPSLRSAYCTSRPLLEFILLASNSPDPTGDTTVKGAPGANTGTGTGMLKVLSLDCSTRSEAFIVCALYENMVGSTSDAAATEPSSLLRLVGFIEVETVRSQVGVTDAPDTPQTRRGSASYDFDNLACASMDEPATVTRKIEKVALKVSSLTNNFPDQTVDMELFRECFQKKLQAMGGKNTFHAFTNKLVSLFNSKNGQLPRHL